MQDIKTFQQNCKNSIKDTFIKQTDKITRTYHSNGKVSSEIEYRNDTPYIEKIFDNTGKLSWIRHFDHSFILSKNMQDWEKAPHIDFKKQQEGKTTTLQINFIDSNSDYKMGCNLDVTNKDGTSFSYILLMDPEKSYYNYDDTGLTKLKEAILELQGIILSDKYKNDFGNSDKLNNGIKKALEYIKQGENNKPNINTNYYNQT